MARRSGRVLAEQVDKKYVSIQVIEAEAIYSIVYDGKPVSIRKSSLASDAPLKYKRTSWPSEGFAKVMARRYNEEFHTDKFSVVALNA